MHLGWTQKRGRAKDVASVLADVRRRKARVLHFKGPKLKDLFEDFYAAARGLDLVDAPLPGWKREA